MLGNITLRQRNHGASRFHGRCEGIVTEEIDDSKLLVKFYHMTMARQDKIVNLDTLNRMEYLVSSLQSKGLARLFV